VVNRQCRVRARAPQGGARHHPLIVTEQLSPTGFTLLAGSSNQFITVGTSLLPIAGYRFSLNAPWSAGASVTFVALQLARPSLVASIRCKVSPCTQAWDGCRRRRRK
jgi:hypothetical protein